MNSTDGISLLGQTEVARESFLRRWRWWLIVGGPLLILAIVGYFVLTGGRTETTDNAYVQIAKDPVAPSVSGRVTDIYVHENQFVRRGQVLFRLDARDLQTNAQAAAAAVANASLQVRALRASYQQQQAMAEAARSTLAYATTEAARQRKLEAAGVSSQQQVDQAVNAVQQARQQLIAAQQAAAQVLANLGGDPNLPPSAAPAVMQAQAQYDRAKLNISYTTVTAPADGVVTRVDQMPLGTYLSASQTAFYLLSGEPVDRGQLQGRPARPHEGRPAGDDQGRRLSRRRHQGPRGQLLAGDRPGVLRAARPERDRQLGEGRAAPAGAHRVRQAAAGDGRPRGSLGEGDGRHTGARPHRRLGAAMITEHDARNRWPITISIMLATLMNSLDQTIANVALPHIQGSVSASADQITWVLTSYIIAAAIMTPLAGWMANRIGRKRMFLISIGGFTLASVFCGMSTSLAELVIFRLMQGVFGAALVPLSQATLLDINPPEKHGQAMAIWGAGAILGPIIGPALGGYFTEDMSWRWCFYINVPIGILAFLGVLFFISRDRMIEFKRFDFLGFGMLTLFIGAVQLVLDRGPTQDWFQSREIWTETILAATGLWIFVVHTLTTRHPFFDRALLRDRNFITATVFAFFIGTILFSSMALLPPMMQTLLGYPVLTSGLLSVPRGLGALAVMFLVGRLAARIETRTLLFLGLALNALGLWEMLGFDLSMGMWPLVVSGFVQGLGTGLIFVPLSTLAFATMPGQPAPRRARRSTTCCATWARPPASRS